MRMVAFLTACCFTWAALAAPPVLTAEEVPPGTQEAVVIIDDFGRFAITATSDQGTSIQVVDRMTGPGTIHGLAGSENGRTDMFLERGDYKLVARSDERGEGTTRLAVSPFVEQHSTAVRLQELKPVRSTLDDLQQRSWWVEVESNQWVNVEAVARHLGDLRFWLDGSWLVDVSPSCDTVEPHEGQPQRRCQLNAKLQPGLYLLSAYGGESLPWSIAGDDKPFYLQWGIKKHGNNLRRTYVMGDVGFERFLLPAETNYVRIELPASAPAVLSQSTYSMENPYGSSRNAVIDKTNRLPVAVLSLSTTSAKVVTVAATPGQPYILQHFTKMGSTTRIPSGNWILGTLHATDPADSIDPTGIIYKVHEKRTEIIDKRALPLTSGSVYQRQFNLLETTKVLLDVHGSGSWWVAKVEGTRANLRIEPFFHQRPPGYSTPSLTEGKASEKLDRGLYVLTMIPIDPGIATLTVRSDNWKDRASSALGGEHKPIEMPPGLSFAPTMVGQSDSVYLYMESQPRIPSGLIRRSLPIDLEQPMSFIVRPDEDVSLSMSVPSAGTLTATNGEGGPVELAANGKWATSHKRSKGSVDVSLRNPGAKAMFVSVQHTPTAMLPTTPLLVLEAKDLEELPKFPKLVGTKTKT
ncbi:MAG: hypothetical protein HN348_27380, partial [Proteobacteria bacterium]|nr:hypothetical protein [Pseudomonadota bacterium]